jgi:hypothetical protein
VALNKKVKEIILENDKLRKQRDDLYDALQVAWLKFGEEMTASQAEKVEGLIDEGKW